MTLNVKAGGREVLERDTSCETRVGADTVLGSQEQSDRFLTLMGEGFSTEETSQESPFKTPAVESTKVGTILDKIRWQVINFLLPEDYEVVRRAPQQFLREFLAEARDLWKSYEPLLGGRNTPVATLQVENPFDEEEL